MSELDKKVEQTQEWDSTGSDNQPTNSTFSVNGQDMTWEQLLDSYNNLQKEFTQRNQKTADEKKNPWDVELEQTKKILKDMGFATNEELDEFKTFKSDIESKQSKDAEDKEFNDFTSEFKTLSETQKVILKDLKQLHKDKDYSEILKTTWFIDQAQLEKSKWNSKVLWGNIWLPPTKDKEENIMDRPNVKKFWMLSSDEYKNRMKSVWL